VLQAPQPNNGRLNPGAAMPNDTKPMQDPDATSGVGREDEPLPAASEDRVLDETARLAREGRKELEADPKEPKPGKA
jgi:hypothetical protein